MTSITMQDFPGLLMTNCRFQAFASSSHPFDHNPMTLEVIYQLATRIYNCRVLYSASGAVFPGTFLPVLMLRVKCSPFRAKAAQFSAVAHFGGLLLACCREEW